MLDFGHKTCCVLAILLEDINGTIVDIKRHVLFEMALICVLISGFKW